MILFAKLVSLKLKLLVGDSQAEPKKAMAEAFRLSKHGSVGIIGPAKSQSVIEVSALMSKIPELDRTIIGYAATSSKLSNSTRLSLKHFLRTPLSDDVHAIMMATLMSGLVGGGAWWGMS